jgi:hypothetical protein
VGCTTEAISKGLCFRSIKTNEEIVIVPNTMLQASDARDALSKALYGRLFDWIVARINESFTSSASQQKNFIGILDIFGFEFFETNSFEQLCINYANEMLQNQFNAFVFQLEQIECALLPLMHSPFIRINLTLSTGTPLRASPGPSSSSSTTNPVLKPSAVRAAAYFRAWTRSALFPLGATAASVTKFAP